MITVGAKRRPSGAVRGSTGRSGLGFPSRRTFQLEAVSVVDEAVEDGVGDCRISEVVVPLFDRDLARDDGRARGVAVLKDLEHVTALLFALSFFYMRFLFKKEDK